MRKSRFTDEQVIGFIKQADAGMSVADLCRREGFSSATFYKWRAKFGGMEASDAKRLRELEAENNRLKKLLAEAVLDNEALKVAFGVKPLSPPAKRRAVGTMLEATSISERRACALVGLSRDSWRHPPQRAQHDRAMSQRIVELAHERRRFGYRRIGDLLRAAGTKINDKRVYRLYKLADLPVRKRRGKQRLKLERVPLHECQSVNEVWSMDFVSDSLASGRRIKCLTVTDDFSHECVDIAVDHGIGGQYVVRVLDQVARFRDYPQAVRTDQGPEFTSRAFMAWTQAKGVRHILNQPGKPTQNAYIESFNGKFRDECLNEHWFQSLKQARAEIARWRIDYNEVRPHSSCGRMPPAKFAAQHRKTAGGAVPAPQQTQE
ncbi:IS3 family transposase [Acidovorax sp. NCPPB 4044]|uniref:IS3 family transposase n=1 Tax=Acidovorax sp. NCPPB 4044 TaxID=2940490 RepID=UPI0023033FEC|nr:IS3 family transposase [Acidovorax sp. NCPPB 4044]MDA8519958.1 IS3 family transposase [Acidovorax sp. NCPPB 4044]MDA8522944.1 IS3 family transposase [Acidovorax sp. NCPPB 4044]